MSQILHTLFLCTTLTTAGTALADPYLIGRGMSDITGEAAEAGMMGYAQVNQKTSGIHLRQRARAFIVADQGNGKRVVFVNADLGQIFQGVQQAVITRLQAKYGATYSAQNVVLSATHDHSGPGGHSHYALYNFTTLGFNARTFTAIVDGIVDAVSAAHADLKPGTVAIGQGKLYNASANRSLPAYEKNPLAERQKWNSSTDLEMTVLRFKQGNTDVGALSWFATHGTSMTPQNTLISGDNKGYAAYRWEHDLNGVRYNSSQNFVAAFAQSNAGDMTPNLNLDGSGPTTNEFDNTRIIGERQLQAALQIYNGPLQAVSGAVDYRHQYVDFSAITVAGQYADGQTRKTCPASLGNAFAAGTEDGRGADGFTEGDLTGNPFLAWLGGVILPTPQWLRTCQAPKPVLMSPGIQTPYPWSPEVLPVSILRIGNLSIVAVPAEFTVMSGRRLKDTVKAALGGGAGYVVLAGYANAYAGYVTTPEEYDAQHYEGASTHFGKWTLPAYQQTLAGLANALRTGAQLPAGPTPRNLAGNQSSFQTGVVLDNVPIFKHFGDVDVAPAAVYARGATVRAEFWTGHPKNNLRRNGTFLEVQRWDGSAWVVMATDGDWNTTYRWVRIDGVWGTSKAKIGWTIPNDATTGYYRIVHRGDYKDGVTGQVYGFTGTTNFFLVN